MACSLSSLWPFNLQQYFPFVSPQSLLPAAWARLGASFTLKVYTDVVVWFAFLTALALLAIAAHFSSAVRRALHYRLVSSRHAVSTVGECALLLAVVALFAFWAVYFSALIHQRVIDDEQGDDSRLGLNVAARVTGHCAVLALALLMFPTARNSMWCVLLVFACFAQFWISFLEIKLIYASFTTQ
jgi:hypothetical protein